jgi:Acyl-CoA carboxylase epsilon subunit
MATTRTGQLGSAEPAGTPSAGTGRPTLRVIRGDATPEEVAALVAVLSAAAAAAPPAAAPAARRSGWSDRRVGHRRSLSAGPSAWRLSARGADNVRTRADW